MPTCPLNQPHAPRAWFAPLGVTTLVVASLLSGCGGGESYTPTTPIETTVDNFPTVVNAESGALMRRGQQVLTNGVKLEYGDTWMYQWINKTANTGYYSTHYLSALDKTSQMYSHTVTFSDSKPFQTQDFGSRNQPLAVSYDNTRCQVTPQERSPFPRRPYAVNSTWSYVWSETCLNGTVVTVVDKTINGRIVALETVTLGLLGQTGVAVGGTVQRAFQTAKYTSTRTETNRQTGTWTYQDTCWHDIAQDRTVLCNTVASFVPAGATDATQTFEQEQRLAFVREVRTTSPVLPTDGASTVAQYAGRWDFKLVGQGGSVTCTDMVISLTGNVTGSCVKVVNTTVNNVTTETRSAFTVSGFVDRRDVTTQASGQAPITRRIDAINLVADSNPNDLSLTGEMVSPISSSGTWLGALSNSGSNLQGTFVARHL